MWLCGDYKGKNQTGPVNSRQRGKKESFNRAVAYGILFVVEEIMLNGYVGIVSRSGLCQIQIERQDTLRQVRQATVAGNRPPRVGFWAILSSDLAHQISSLIEEGEGREALRVLNQVVREGGHLLPLNH